MKATKTTLLALIIGAAFGYSANYWLPENSGIQEHTHTSVQPSGNTKEPLYWVAPMDSNYRRDKPGKSPMGMDLVPVYEEGVYANNHQPGTVTINPSIENNLGVKTAPVSKGKLAPEIKTVGYIAFDESQLWQTNVRVAGWVEKLFVTSEGEKVNKGDVLFTLYSPELIKAQEELLSAYRSGHKGLIKGATERLIALGVDKQQIQKITRRNRVSEHIEVKAINDGIIKTLNIREGGYLSPASTAISVGPLDNIWVDAQVFERQSQWVKAGGKATMTIDTLPGKVWEGEIDYVYPILDPNNRTVKVRLKFVNKNGELKPNMFASISLEPVTTESVLITPKNAVIHANGMARIVLSEGDGRYRSARIQTGREAGEYIEVISGLKVNDQVVTSAQFLLDSESSKTAELSRINNPKRSPNETWIDGNITVLLKEFGMVTLHHGAVDKLKWKEGEINFSADSTIDLSSFSEGEHVRFLVAKEGSDYLLRTIESAEGEPK